MKALLTTLALIISFTAFTQNVKTIKIVNIKDIPLKCKLYFNGQDMGYASNGEIDIPAECTFTDRLDIEPVDTETYEGRKNLPCYSINNKIIIFIYIIVRNLTITNPLKKYITEKKKFKKI